MQEYFYTKLSAFMYHMSSQSQVSLILIN